MLSLLPGDPAGNRRRRSGWEGPAGVFVSWTVLILAFWFVLECMVPGPGELCELEGGSWLEAEGLTACVGP